MMYGTAFSSKHDLLLVVPFFEKIFYLLEYAQVIKMLGNGRLEAMCFDGVKRLCHIRGKLRKKVHFTDLVCEASD